MLGDELRAALLGVVARAAELRETFADEVQIRRDAAAGGRLVSGGTDVEDNRPGARARLLPVPARATPEPATARGEELSHRRILFAPRLTLPDGYDAAERLGLDVYENQAYVAATQALWEASGEPSWFGTRQFRVPADALARGDYSAVRAEPSSC